MNGNFFTVGLILVLLLPVSCTGEKENKASLPSQSQSPAHGAAQIENTSAATSATDPSNSATPNNPSSSVQSASVSVEGGTASGTDGSATSNLQNEARSAESTGQALKNLADKSLPVRLSGNVEANRHAELAFRVPGFLGQVAAKSGTSVKKGELLATLDERDYVLRLELAKSRRDLARVGFDVAKKELEREKQLRTESVSTESNFDRTFAAFEQARLQLRLAELDVQSSMQGLDDTKLRAPYDGVVVSTKKQEGENVPAGTTVVDFVGSGEPEVTLNAPEKMLGVIKVGSKLQVHVPSVGFTGDAEVMRVVPVISEKNRSFQIFAVFKSAPAKVVSGLYAEALID